MIDRLGAALQYAFVTYAAGFLIVVLKLLNL